MNSNTEQEKDVIKQLKSMVPADVWRLLGNDEKEADDVALSALAANCFWETIANVFISQDKSQLMSKVFTPLGASNHTEQEREPHDYYATDPIAAEWLLKIEDFPKDEPIWECCAGECHLADVFVDNGYSVRKSDIVKRRDDIEQLNFLNPKNSERWNGNIITNPPYSMAYEIIVQALSLIPNDKKVAMFLKVTFLEGKERKRLFEAFPPKTIWVSSSRILCAKNGQFERMKQSGGSAMAFAWFVWRKGYKGDTIVKWFN